MGKAACRWNRLGMEIRSLIFNLLIMRWYKQPVGHWIYKSKVPRLGQTRFRFGGCQSGVEGRSGLSAPFCSAPATGSVPISYFLCFVACWNGSSAEGEWVHNLNIKVVWSWRCWCLQTNWPVRIIQKRWNVISPKKKCDFLINWISVKLISAQAAIPWSRLTSHRVPSTPQNDCILGRCFTPWKPQPHEMVRE